MKFSSNYNKCLPEFRYHTFVLAPSISNLFYIPVTFNTLSFIIQPRMENSFSRFYCYQVTKGKRPSNIVFFLVREARTYSDLFSTRFRVAFLPS